MPSLTALLPASVAGALGIALLIVAIVDDPPRHRGGRGAWLVCGLAFAVGALAVGLLASLGEGLAALTAGGLALAGAAGLVALLRARGDDDDDGRGWNEEPEPPDDPGGGIVIDWDEFERALWAYVAARESVEA